MKRLCSKKNVGTERVAFLSSAVNRKLHLSVHKQFVETMKLPSDFCEIADEINYRGYEVLRTGHRLSEYSNIIAGNNEDKTHIREVGDILSLILERAKPFLDKKNIALNHSFPKTPFFVEIDEEGFCYAVLELLLNAGEYSRKGSKIKISVTATKKFVKISVIDEGCGMGEEVLSFCTEPFFSTSEIKTGLGLTLVNNFAERSGGRFSLISKEGEGTFAQIFLPLIPPEKAVGVETADDFITKEKISPVELMLSGIEKS